MPTPTPLTEDGLLTPDDPPPFRVVNPGGAAAVLVVCDHAANAVPRRLGSLGLPAEELGRHIGWDLGAEAVARGLAERLDAPAVLASFSRLVIDGNRRLDDPGSILAESDGTVVPGNACVGAAAREAIASAVYWPYHRAIAAALDRFAARGVTPVLLSVHSFTPRLNGRARPWHVGVLWDRDGRVAVPLLRELSRCPGLVVGDNEPYSARTPTDFTIPYHAEARGLPHVTLELRQDEVGFGAGAARYAALIARALAPTLADPGLFQRWRGEP